MATITIIGGHGKIALLATPLLTSAGHTVRSVVRNPDHSDDVAATGAEPVVADVESMDTAAITGLLDGADVVVWSAGAGGGDPHRTKAVDQDAAIRSMDAARAAGVDHYVMVSYFGARRDHGVPADNPFFAYAEAKAAADEHLRGSGLAYTILKPSRLMLGTQTGRINIRATESGEVDRADVAAVIAGVVERRDTLAGQEISFNNGQQPIGEALDSL
ncbi:SDR family oxidoreductase [Mariniluteicoccus endophyticus]